MEHPCTPLPSGRLAASRGRLHVTNNDEPESAALQIIEPLEAHFPRLGAAALQFQQWIMG